MPEEKQPATPSVPVDPKPRPPDTVGSNRLSRWIWAPVSAEGNRLVVFLRGCCRVFIIVGQEFVRDRIPLRASALTFTVILAMVPTLALGTAVLKGLGFGGEIREAAHTFISQLEVTAGELSQASYPRMSGPVQATTSAADAATAAALVAAGKASAGLPADLPAADAPDTPAAEPAVTPADQEAGPVEITEDSQTDNQADAQDAAQAGNHDDADEMEEASLSGHLHRVVDTLFDYVDKTNFATMGLIGVLVLLLTVFSVLDSIEKTFNDIWQARSGRSLGKKLTDYLALLVILPLTINFGVAAMAALQNPEFLVVVEYWVPWLGLKVMKILPVLAVVATFTTLYSFLPNTRVTRTAALTGGFFGGLGWLLLQAVYFKLQIVVVRYNAIYGSFAALPLFLLWIHFSWMTFLLGAEVSFAVQIWRRYLWKKLTLSPIGRLGLAFEILAVTAGDYRQKRLTTRDSLVWALKQPDAYIKELLDALSRAGVLRYIPDDGGAYLPSGPLAGLNPVEIGNLLLGELPPTISADNPAVEALQALRQRLAGRKLRPRE